MANNPHTSQTHLIAHFYAIALLVTLSAHFANVNADEVEAIGEAYPVAFADNLSEDDYLGELPRVLTVSRLSQSIADAPSAVTIIDRNTIRASGAVDIPELFRLVPGMYVGTNAGFVYNTNHAVSYHGMTTAYPGNMQVMINGRSVYSPLFGGVNWSELPIAIADIDRIEVTRGPNAASYGANSYFGVINILTQHPSEVSGNSIIATHGNGRNEAFYRYGGKLNDLSYRITTGYREDDGLDNRNDFKRTRLLNAQADYRLNDKDSLEFEFGLADGARGEGDMNEDPLVFLPRTKQITNHNELIRWRHNIGQDSDFLLQAFHSYDRSDDQTSSIDLRPILRAGFFESEFDRQIARGRSVASATARANLFANSNIANIPTGVISIKNEVETERYDLEAQHTFAIGKTIRAVWGGSVRQDSLQAAYFLGTSKTDYFNLQRLFGHAEWQAHEKLVLNAGAMMEHNDFTGTDISPRASINFKLNPNHTIRLGASSALRTPNYVEEKFQRRLTLATSLPNTTLLLQQDADKGNVRPEQIVSREIGYLGKLGNISLDARLFYDTVTDHIRFRDRKDFVVPSGFVLLATDDIASGTNEGSAKINGFEAQAKWQIAAKSNVLLNFAHVKIRETQRELKRSYTESAPSNTVSALFTHQFDQNWDASIAYYQTSEVTALGDGDPVDLIRRTDVRLARKFNVNRVQGEVSAVVENLFNNRYEEFADYNTLERRARINLRLDF